MSDAHAKVLADARAMIAETLAARLSEPLALAEIPAMLRAVLALERSLTERRLLIALAKRAASRVYGDGDFPDVSDDGIAALLADLGE